MIGFAVSITMVLIYLMLTAGCLGSGRRPRPIRASRKYRRHPPVDPRHRSHLLPQPPFFIEAGSLPNLSRHFAAAVVSFCFLRYRSRPVHTNRRAFDALVFPPISWVSRRNRIPFWTGRFEKKSRKKLLYFAKFGGILHTLWDTGENPEWYTFSDFRQFP